MELELEPVAAGDLCGRRRDMSVKMHLNRWTTRTVFAFIITVTNDVLPLILALDIVQSADTAIMRVDLGLNLGVLVTAVLRLGRRSRSDTRRNHTATSNPVSMRT